MNKKKRKNGGGSQSMTSLKRSDYFEQLNKIQQEGKSYAVGNAAACLYRTKIEGMFTIRFEKGMWWDPSALDEDFDFWDIRLATARGYFMKYFADLSGLEEADIHWAGTEDVEEDRVVNSHILFNFLPLEINGESSQSFMGYQSRADAALTMVCARLGLERKLINVHWVEAYDQDRLIEFFDKLNPGESENSYGCSDHFDFWLTKDMMETDYEDLSPSERGIVDLYRKN